MKKIPQWLHYSLSLLVLGLIAGLLLAFFNELTAKPIEQNLFNKMMNVLDDELPQYKDLSCDDILNDIPEKSQFKHVYRYSDETSTKAIVYYISTKGYQNGLISILMTIDYETNKINQFRIIEAKEQLEKVSNSDYNLLDASIDSFAFVNLTGATISSTAIKKAVNIVADHYVQYKEILGGAK